MATILMYHEVISEEKATGKRLLRIHPSNCLPIEQFENQMKYLFTNKFRVLSLNELLTFPSKKDLLSEKIIVITFDDGHIGNYQYAFPILKKYKLTATFFVSTGLIGKPKMLSWEQLQEMTDNGMSVQSHGISHAPLSTLGDKQIVEELQGSKKILEDNLGKDVFYLSLPHGDYDQRLSSIAQKLGFKIIFTSCPEYFSGQSDNLFCGRFEIKSDNNFDYFVSIVENKNPYIRLFSLYSKAKMKFRSWIGVNNYRKVFRFFNRIKLENGTNGECGGA